VAPPYVIDTSVWIHVGRHHPPDIFRSVWQRFDIAAAAGDIVSPEEVLHELEQGDDALAAYLGARSGLFVPLDEAQMTAVAEVVRACPGLVDEEAERGRADPFVVALARVRGGTVVTGERPRRGSTAPFRIPDACAHYGLSCLDWLGFLREIGWQL
jgi:Domain of unknown function (DUF4411)